ncbi:MAG: hypothetical protein AAF447_08135 [Myxococcota bacterium]
MTALDGNVESVAHALALESAMFAEPHAGCGVWWTRPGLVVPRSLARLPGFPRARDALAAQGLPVVVRGSGGGVVPQGPGILNVTVTVPLRAQRHATQADFAWLAAPLRRWLAERDITTEVRSVPGSFCDGDHNVVVSGRKLAGTAQRRGRSRALLHMVLLVRPDLERSLDSVARLRRLLGRPGALSLHAHTTLASLAPDLGDVEVVAAELRTRFRRSLALRPDRQSPASNAMCSSPGDAA